MFRTVSWPTAFAAVFFVLASLSSINAASAQANTSHNAPPSEAIGLNLRPAPGSVPRTEITRVVSGSAAAAAGLMPGDVLLYAREADGGRVSLTDPATFDGWVNSQAPGSTQTLAVLRGDSLVDVTITLNAAAPPQASQTPQTFQPAQTPAAPPIQTASPQPPQSIPHAAAQGAGIESLLLGLKVQDKASSKGGGAKVRSVARGSAAEAAGIKKSDVIESVRTAAGSTTIADQAALIAWHKAQQSGTTANFDLKRGKETVSVSVLISGIEFNGMAEKLEAKSRLERDYSVPNNTEYPLNAVVLKAGETIELEITTTTAAITPKICWLESSVWNVDPEVCSTKEPIPANSTVIYRHRAAEDEYYYMTLENPPAATPGTYTVKTRNGRPKQSGAEALARLEAMGDRIYIITNSMNGFEIKTAVNYQVTEAGRSGDFIMQYENGQTAFRRVQLGNDGELQWTDNASETGFALAGAGPLIDFYRPINVRIGYGVTADGNLLRTVDQLTRYADAAKTLGLGRYKRTLTTVDSPATAEEVAAMLQNGPARLASLEKKRIADWGFLPKLAGKFWLFTVDGVERIGNWEWEAEGRVMLAKYWNSDALNTTPNPLVRMTHDSQSGHIDVLGTYPNNNTYQRRIYKGANNEMIDEGANGKDVMIEKSANEIVVNFQSQYGPVSQSRKALDPQTLNAYVERTRVTQQRLAQEKARQDEIRRQEEIRRQQQIAAQQQDDGMDFGALLSFAGGVASGQSPEQAMVGALAPSMSNEVGAIMQGAAAANTGSMSGNLSAGIDSAFANALNQAVPGVVDAARAANPNVAATAGMPNVGGMTGAGAVVRGQNQAAQYCPGFTMENYRTYAFQGGANQQLFSLCGQAYELYKIHLNAVNQGYSQADANLSWDQHVAATSQIRAFVQ